MSQLWKKFRSTGESQPILPPAPPGTVIAFAGSTSSAPAGWLNVAGGPYLASKYEALAAVIGTATPLTQNLNISAYMFGKALVGYGGAYAEGRRTLGGQATAPVLNGDQTGLRAHSDHTMGNRHHHSMPGATSHQHAVLTQEKTIRISNNAYEAKTALSNFLEEFEAEDVLSFKSEGAKYGLTLAATPTGADIIEHGENAVAGSAGHENRQPTLELIYLIKT